MKTCHEVKQALDAGNEAQLRRSMERMKRDLDRCLAWAKAGYGREAAAYNIDGGNIVAHAIQLKQSSAVRALMDELDFPDDQSLDELARLHATASAHAAAVSAWRSAAVSSASAADRLGCLRTLRRLEPRQAIWADAVEQIEQDVVQAWKPRVQACIGAGDLADIRHCRKVFESINAGGSGGRALLAELDDALALGARKIAAQEMEELDRQLYRAWLAMDEPLARVLLDRVRSLGADAGVASVLQPAMGQLTGWLDRQQEAVQRRASQRLHVERLEQLLDEDRPVSEFEPLYADLRASDVSMTPMLESRVAHRYATAKRRHRRRFALGLTAILAMAVLAVIAINLSLRSARYQQTIEGMAAAIQSDLEAGNLESAFRTWRQASESSLTDSPVLASLKGRIEQAQKQRLADVAQGAEWIDQATQLTSINPESIASLEQATDLLEQVASLGISEHAKALKQTRDQVDDLRRAAYEVERQSALDVLAVARGRLEESAPGGGKSLDPDAWAEWMKLDDVQSMLDKTRRSPVGTQPDISQAIEKLAQMRTNRMERAQLRLESLEKADALLGQLAETPASEQEWLRVWQSLLDEHLDVLADTGPVHQWHRGRRAAEAAVALSHWRMVVRPAVEAALQSSDSDSMSRLARGAATALRNHMERHDGSPYGQAAVKMLPMLTALSSPQFHKGPHELVEKTHLLDLARMPILRGGWIYVRPPENTRSIRIIEDLESFSLPPELLDPDPIDASVGPIGQLDFVALSSALSDWIERPVATSPRGCAIAVLQMVEDVVSTDELDLLLRLYATKQAWLVALETLRPIAPKAVEPVDRWINDLSVIAPMAAQSDWPAMAAAATSPQQRRIRTQAATALAQSPDVDAIRTSVLASFRDMDAAMISHVPAGVLIPQGDHMEGMWPAGTAPQELMVLVSDEAGRWQLVPVELDASNRIPMGALNLPETPAVLFSP